MHTLWTTRRAKLGRWFAPKLECSFCRKGADEVSRLVAGASAHICDACIVKCVDVLNQHGGLHPTSTSH
jgi:ClpX C4-type zinc finger